MSPRPDDVRLKQLQHEKNERLKQGLDKLERRSGLLHFRLLSCVYVERDLLTEF